MKHGYEWLGYEDTDRADNGRSGTYTLAPGSKLKGKRGQIPPRSPSVNGVWFGYLQRRVDVYIVTRVQFTRHDVELQHEVVITERHIGSAEMGPNSVHIDNDQLAKNMLADCVKANLDNESLRALIRATGL